MSTPEPPAPTPIHGEPLNISDEERARLPKLGIPDDTMVEGISHPPLRPEVLAELDAFREHLTWHREDSAPDCRFCTERDAKKRPRAPAAPTPSATTCARCGHSKAAHISGVGLCETIPPCGCEEFVPPTESDRVCGKCGHVPHDRYCEVWIPSLHGGVVCGCTARSLDVGTPECTCSYRDILGHPERRGPVHQSNCPMYAPAADVVPPASAPAATADSESHAACAFPCPECDAQLDPRPAATAGTEPRPAATDYACPECHGDTVFADRRDAVGICSRCGWFGPVGDAVPTGEEAETPNADDLEYLRAVLRDRPDAAPWNGMGAFRSLERVWRTVESLLAERDAQASTRLSSA